MLLRASVPLWFAPPCGGTLPAMSESAPSAEHPTRTEFITAMAHLYRGEMNRMTVWRQRLDITSNWAIILTTGLTTFTLGAPNIPHYTLLLGLAIIGISILIEARRYRHLHHSKWRLYLMEAGFFAEMLDPIAGEANRRWRELIAADLRRTVFPLSLFTAVRARLRRNYLLLVYFVTAVWIVKVVIHPTRAASLAEFWKNLHIGDNLIPPWFVAITAVLFVGGATALSLTCPTQEALDDWGAHYGDPAPPTLPEA